MVRKRIITLGLILGLSVNQIMLYQAKSVAADNSTNWFPLNHKVSIDTNSISKYNNINVAAGPNTFSYIMKVKTDPNIDRQYGVNFSNVLLTIVTDCDKRQEALIKIEGIEPDGKIVNVPFKNSIRWINITPGTNGEYKYNIVCKQNYNVANNFQKASANYDAYNYTQNKTPNYSNYNINSDYNPNRPEWKDFAPYGWDNVTLDPKEGTYWNSTKIQQAAARHYWYDRRRDFEKDLAKCDSLQENSKDICYQKLINRQFDINTNKAQQEQQELTIRMQQQQINAMNNFSNAIRYQNVNINHSGTVNRNINFHSW